MPAGTGRPFSRRDLTSLLSPAQLREVRSHLDHIQIALNQSRADGVFLPDVAHERHCSLKGRHQLSR